jgi:3'-5' exoribonuclease 1
MEQPFQYIAVLDFEATCEEKASKDYQNEIIEFPIVLIDVQQQTIVSDYFRERYSCHDSVLLR